MRVRLKLRKICAILTCLIMCLSTVIPTFALDKDIYVDEDGTVYDVTPFKVLNVNDEEVKSKWLSGSSEYVDQTWYHEMSGLTENSDFKIENTYPSVYTIKVKNFKGDEKQPISSEAGENPKLRYNLDAFKASPEEVRKYVGRANASKMDTTQSHAIVKVECTYDDGEHILNSCYNLLFTTGAIQSTTDKSALDAAIAAAPNIKTDKTYYHSDDRYNGKDTSTKGFWADMEAVVNKAKAVQADPIATQEEVNAETARLNRENKDSALSVAISKLIPASQANATFLYETLQSVKDLQNTDDKYTQVSWDNFTNARTKAQEKFDSLFITKDGTRVANEETNLAKNQTAIDKVAEDLKNARKDLLESKGLEERIAIWQSTAKWLLGQKSQVEKGSYEAETMAAWKTAYETLAAARTDGYQTASTYQAYKKNVTALSDAYYGLQDAKKGPVKVHARVADNFGALFPEYAIADAKTATYDDKVELNAQEATLASLLEAMQYDDTPKKTTPSKGTQYGEGWKNPEVLVYINGILAAKRTSFDVSEWKGYIGANRDGKLNKDDLYFDVQLHDGDEIVLVRTLGPGFNYYGDIAAGGSKYNFYYKSLALLDLKETLIEVEAGKEFTVTAEKTAAAAELERSRKAAANVSLFLSEKQESKEEAQKSPALTDAGSKTDAQGKASLVLYKEGWYRLAAVDVSSQTPTVGNNNGDESGGDFPNLAAGDYVLVHVKPSTDTDSVRTKLQEELDAVYHAYAEEFYGEDTETVKDLYTRTSETIADSQLLGDAYSAKEDAVVQLKTLQKQHEKVNENFLKTVRWYLDRLPADENPEKTFTKAYKQRFEGLQEAYTAATSYQRKLLDGQQEAQYRALLKVYGTDGSGLEEQKLPTVKVTVEGDKSLQDKLILSHNYYRYETVKYKEDGMYSATLNQEYGTFREGKPKNSWYNLAGEFDSNDFKVLQGSDWYLAGIYAAKTPTSHKISDLGYEIYKIEVEGAADAEVSILKELPQGSTEVYNKETGKFIKPYFRIASVTINNTPSNDIHIKVYVRSSDAEKTLAEYQNIAKEELKAKYESYQKSAYTTSAWAQLTKAYQDGIAAIEAVKEEADAKTAVENAKTKAIAAMDAIKTRSDESQGTVPGGETSGKYGSVRVTISNETYKGAPASMQGTFLKKDMPLNQDTTMMSAILDALEQEKYTWEGTGSKNPKGKDITYIASIWNENKEELGEFTGGPESGWMGTLNDWFTNLSFAEFSVAKGNLTDGDVIEVKYTCSLGRDIDSDWGNPDTSLSSLSTGGGSLTPGFAKNQKSYTLVKNGSSVSVSAAAQNKNYQVRIYLNDKKGSNYYRSGESLPVKAGDTIYVGVGGRGWPSMNSNAGYAISYDETWYEIKVADSTSSSEVVKLIEKIGKITYGNYMDKIDAVQTARNAYNALTTKARGEVKNYSTLQDAEKSLTFFRQIDEAKEKLAALPKLTNPTKAQAEKYRTQINEATKAYKKLSDKQQEYITQVDLENYNALAKALGVATIAGSAEIPESEVVTDVKAGTTTAETEVTASEKTNADGTKTKVADVKVSTGNQKEILKQAKEKKSNEIILVVSSKEVGDATKADVTLEKSFIDSIVKDTDAKLTIKTPFGDKTYTQEELKAMSDAATGSAITVAIEKAAEEPANDNANLAKAKSIVKDLKLVARSSKTAKKNIKAVLKSDAKVKASIRELKELGFTVKYRFYRSTKKAASYKSTVTKKAATYTNTAGKKGTKYFYKVQVRVYDENGKLITKTALKQCKYASRVWTKVK